MAWDETLPADGTQLRLGPGFIRDNWTAIQNAETSLSQAGINLAKQASNLSNVDEVFRVFSKIVTVAAVTSSELFGIAGDVTTGDVVQLTNTAHNSIGANGSFFLGGDGTTGLVVKWGSDTFASGAATSKTVAFAGTPVVAVYTVLILPSAPTPTVANLYTFSAPSTTGFSANRVAGTSPNTFYYLALGSVGV